MTLGRKSEINRSSETAKSKAEILLAQELSIRLGLFLALGMLIPMALVTAFSGSLLLWSDFLDYGRIIFSGIVSWRILHTVRKGRTHHYDYGSGKLETLGSLVGAAIYLVGLLVMAGMTVERLMHPIQLDLGYTALGSFFLLVGVSTDGYLWMRNRRLAKLLYSPVMEMQWRSNRADALGYFATFSGLALTVATFDFPWSVYIDPIFNLIFIVYAAISFLPGLAKGFYELLDRTLEEEFQVRIDKHLVKHFSDYSGFHGVRSRRSGGQFFIEIALSFDPAHTIATVQRTVEALQRGIEADIPGSELRVALIPAEPAEREPEDFVERTKDLRVHGAIP